MHLPAQVESMRKPRMQSSGGGVLPSGQASQVSTIGRVMSTQSGYMGHPPTANNSMGGAGPALRSPRTAGARLPPSRRRSCCGCRRDEPLAALHCAHPASPRCLKPAARRVCADVGRGNGQPIPMDIMGRATTQDTTSPPMMPSRVDVGPR
jgi:hypothetical protein